MNIEAREILGAIVVGVGATLMMDGWNLFLERVFRIPSLDYGLLGRWVLHMPEGTFRHPSIRSASPKPFERTIGWLAHYSIGVVLALGLGVASSRVPNPARARAKSLVTHTVFGVGLYVCSLCLSALLGGPG